MLDVPAELLRYLTRLLAAERRHRGTPARSRKLTCRDQALLALRWFRDRTRPGRLAADHGFAREDQREGRLSFACAQRLCIVMHGG